MELRPSARAFVRLGVVLLLVAAAASVWELLASQAPSSHWHVGVLPGPVAQLRGTAGFLSLVSFAIAWLVPFLAPTREPWILVGGAIAGTVLLLGAMTYAAATGMYGVQIHDPRPDSQSLFTVRALGMGTLGACLLDLLRRALVPRRVASGDESR